MAITYPITDLLEATHIQTSTFRPLFGQDQSTLASGEVLTGTLRPLLWEGMFVSRPLSHSECERVGARILALQGSIYTFLGYNLKLRGPQADPTGGGLSGYTPIIETLGSNNKSLSLSGLPEGYALNEGDAVGWVYSTSRIAYHKILEPVVADSSGETPEFEVQPHIRAGVAVDTNVVLVNPPVLMKIKAGSLEEEPIDSMHNRISYVGLQVA